MAPTTDRCLDRSEVVDLPVESMEGLVAELLVQGHVPVFRVHDDRMDPTLKEGDAVTLVPYGQSRVRRGDIVAFHRDSQLVLDRVLGVTPTEDGPCFITGGDDAGAGGGVQPEEAILGKVTLVTTPQGCWRPDSLPRRAQAALRVFLGLHPALQSRFSIVSTGLMRLIAPVPGSGQKTGGGQ